MRCCSTSVIVRIVAIAEADAAGSPCVEAAATLGVAAETIRRDLSALQHEGLIRRVHGGAVPIDQQRYEPLVHKREHVRVEEKTRIARAALDELPESGVLMIDAGSTPRRFAELLPRRSAVHGRHQLRCRSPPRSSRSRTST